MTLRLSSITRFIDIYDILFHLLGCVSRRHRQNADSRSDGQTDDDACHYTVKKKRTSALPTSGVAGELTVRRGTACSVVAAREPWTPLRNSSTLCSVDVYEYRLLLIVYNEINIKERDSPENIEPHRKLQWNHACSIYMP